jgi:hypothetical protein
MAAVAAADSGAEQHHQRTNGSTNVKMFTSPDNLNFFYQSTLFEVCDIGRGDLVIGKLLEILFCKYL